MTIQVLKRKKQELLASQVSRIASDTNENLLRVNLSKFFTDLEHDVQSALLEYWNDHMLLQGQVNLILASIHEKHQEYYELIMRHKLQEFHRAEQMGKRLVKRQQQSAMKASKPVKITATPNNLFGTLQYSEDKLANDTFKASQNTLNRVDNNINEILLDGYRQGVGINEVSRQITERFDQLRTWEAKRIARTEIHTAQNMGVMNSYESLGVEYTQWIAASDDRTRESHVEIDREIIPIGGTYSNGLAFPGDTSGPIEEWINCRCSNAPFVLPAGMMAPSFSPFREEDLVPIEVEPQVPEQIPPEPNIIDQKLDYFGQQYVNSKIEHMQFFTKNASSEVSHGYDGSVNKNGAQHRWLNEHKKNYPDEEIHGTHNHPAAKEGYTMLSLADVEMFITDNVGRWEGYNLKSMSAENPLNRITIERLPDFYEKYNVRLGNVQSDAIRNAYKLVDGFYDKYNPQVGPGLEFRRNKLQELRDKGLSDKQAREEYERLYSQEEERLEEQLHQERQNNFPKLIEDMNEILNEHGLNLKVVYKDKVPRPKVSKPVDTIKVDITSKNSNSFNDLKKELTVIKKQIKETNDPNKKKLLRKFYREKLKELKNQMS